MSLSDTLLDMSYIPGVGAAFLAVYNWFQLRKGPKLIPIEFVTYGFFPTATQNHLFFPILVNNDGRNVGLVSDLSISFEGSDAKSHLTIKRRVELRMDEDRTNRSPNPDLRDYKELVPLLPVHIPANSGEFVILECIDVTDERQVIQEDAKLTCTIEIKYSNRKSNVSFPFELKSKHIPTTGGLVWLNP